MLVNVFNEHRDAIVELHEKWYREESYKGTSNFMYKVSMYHIAIYLAVLIYLELKDGYETDWDYYVDKYSLNQNRKKLACCGIDLDTILASFGLPAVDKAGCVNGVESMEVEHCLVIEPTDLPVISTPAIGNITHLLSTPHECFSYIN